MNTFNGLLFEVTGEELAKSFTKTAEFHAERAAHFETKRGEWDALPKPVQARRSVVEDESAREKLLAELAEARSLKRATLSESLEAFDGGILFTQKVEYHRAENVRLTFLANHVPKDATYALTYGELRSAGLIEHDDGPSAGYEKSDRRY